MAVAGVDVGSRSVKLVILNEGRVIYSGVLVTEEEGGVAARAMLDEALAVLKLRAEDIEFTVATGIGRDTVAFASRQRSEQLCHARGAYWLFPLARTVLDVGAGGSRAMRLDGAGKVSDFSMNTKCASGTGAFLEDMTKIVDMPLEVMAEMAANAQGKARVSSFCAVFAESEVISNIHKGLPLDYIVAGIHEAVVDRLVELLGRVHMAEEVVVTGGVARNRGVLKSLESRLGLKLRVPQEPELTGALGAALIAQDTVSRARTAAKGQVPERETV